MLVAACGMPVPAPVESFLKQAGSAASPCALICLGVFLGGERVPAAASQGAWLLTLAKLFVRPALA